MLNIKDHQIDRTVMMWGVKFKANKARNGKLLVMKEEKVMTPIKYLTPEHIQNLQIMLRKNPGVWNGYPEDVWINALNNEVLYRNKRADVFINQVIKLSEFNVLGKIFELHPRESFMQLKS